jgi:hypothetical protein
MSAATIKAGIIHSRKIRGLAAVLLMAALVGAALFRREHHQTSVSASANVTFPKEISRITFVSAGDVIPHAPVVQAAAAAAQNQNAAPDASRPAGDGGWDALFANVADIFRQADFGFVNLETPVAPAHSRGSKPFQFDAPINLLQALKFSGVKIVSFANNHVFDQNYAGFNETQEHLREQGLLFTGAGSSAGAAWNPVIVEKNGIKSAGWA